MYTPYRFYIKELYYKILCLGVLSINTFYAMGQCSDLVKVETDRFEKLTTQTTLKPLILENAACRFEINAKSKTPTGGKSILFFLNMRVTAKSDFAVAVDRDGGRIDATVYFLFEDGSTFTLAIRDNWYNTLKAGQSIPSIELHLYREGCCMSTELKQVEEMETIYRKLFCNKKITAIRVANFGAIESKIDFDIAPMYQSYFINVLDCMGIPKY